MKDLHTENFKTLMKTLKNTPINGKISCSHGMEQLMLLKYPCYPKQWTQWMQSLPKFHGIFPPNRANPPNICGEPQRTPNSQRNPEKRERAGGISLPDVTLCWEATVTKTVWNWLKTGTGTRGTGQRDQNSTHTDGVGEFMTQGPRTHQGARHSPR